MGGTIATDIAGGEGGGRTIGVSMFWLVVDAIGFTVVDILFSVVVGLEVVVVGVVVEVGAFFVVVIGLSWLPLLLWLLLL